MYLHHVSNSTFFRTVLCGLTPVNSIRSYAVLFAANMTTTGHTTLSAPALSAPALPAPALPAPALPASSARKESDEQA